jgi:hypothetical protein
VIRLNNGMARALQKAILSTDEQLKLFKEFLPLREALRAELARRHGGVDPFAQLELDLGVTSSAKRRSPKTAFSGGYRSLNLHEAYKALPRTKELVRARRAQEKLIERNMPMAINLAHRFYASKKQTNVNGDDYAQVGCLGLTYATYHYTPESNGKKIKFSTYAQFWIKALIMEELKGAKLIKPRKGEPEPRFYTEVKDSDGCYTPIFDSLDITHEPSLGEQLVTVINGQASLQPEITEQLTPEEHSLLTLDLSSPLMVSATLGLPLGDSTISIARERKAQAVGKLKALLSV